MDFIDQIKQFSERIVMLQDNIKTEEATKTSIVLPFFSMLGYDIFNPNEFVPEFTADVGIKKGEKVDYAILLEGKPTILIEVKSIREKLKRHSSQLFRYFGTTHAKFAILTNGIIYQFFTDLDNVNKMDEKPFLEINLLDVKDAQLPELKKFCKSNFNIEEIFSVASDLKYSNEFRNMLSNELNSPSDEFVRFFLNKTYTGIKTQPVIEKFKPILKKALNSYITELMSDKIKSALDTDDFAVNNKTGENSKAVDAIHEELEAYFIIKNLLSDSVPMVDLFYKDSEKYASVLYKNKKTKLVCRISLNAAKKFISIPDGKKKLVQFNINNIYDIQLYSSQLIAIVSEYVSEDSTINSAVQKDIDNKKIKPKDDSPVSTLAKSKDILLVDTLVRGQKINVSSLQMNEKLDIQLSIDKSQQKIVDISCFCLDNKNVLLGDDYFIFYNQLESADKSIKMNINEKLSITSLEVNLGLLSKSAQKIVVAMAIDGDMTMSQLKEGNITFGDKNCDKLAEYKFDGEQFQTEKAVILCEVYRKSNDWTVSIVSRGFNGGLEELLKHFGGEIK